MPFRPSARNISPLSRQILWLSTALLAAIAFYIFWHFPHDSLWYDETVNAYLATSSWHTVWEWVTEIDNQVPLHFAVLKLWGSGAGYSEFSLRAFSALCALLAAAGMMALGKRIFQNAALGWFAALCFVLPGSFTYALGEVRVYALALALLIWSCVFLWELWRKPPSWRWFLLGGYLFTTLPFLYTHYTAWLAIAAQAVFILARLAETRLSGKRLAIFLATALVLGYVPWLIALGGRDVNSGTAFEGKVAVDIAIETYLHFYLFGQKISADGAGLPVSIAPFLGALAIWTFLAMRRQKDRAPVVLSTMLIIIPLVGMTYAVNQIEGKLAGRHTWVMWVGLALGLTGLVQALMAVLPSKWRWILPLFVLALLAQMVNSRDLVDEYPGNFRAAFDILRREATPHDILLLRDGTLFTAAQYYASTIPYVGIPPDKLTNVNHEVQLAEALDNLSMHWTPQTQHIWVLSWQGDTMDPTKLGFAIPEYMSRGQRRVWLEPKSTSNVATNDVTLVQYTLDPTQRWLWEQVGAYPGILQVPPDGPSLLGYEVFYPPSQHNQCAVIVHTWWWRGQTDYPDTMMSVRLVAPDDTRLVQADLPPAGYRFGQEKWSLHTLGRVELRYPCAALKKNTPYRLELIVFDRHGTKPSQPVTLDTLVQSS